MTKAKKLLGVFAVLGVGAGLAYWFYLKVTDPGNAPSANDLLQDVQSYFRRGLLVVTGKTSSDPITIAVGFIAQQESFSSTVYPDPPGQSATFSIGYGHQLVAGDGFDQSSTISEADAYALLEADLETYVNCVNNSVSVTLNPNQLAALYDFCYNEGCGAFESSTLLADINKGDIPDVPTQLERWVYAGGAIDEGLEARRQSEITLFNS